MPNQYGDDAVDEILALEQSQRREAAAKEALGEVAAEAPKPSKPQSDAAPVDRR
jgi:hypothetical protein